MISLINKQQIILRHINGESNRDIAKALHIDKNTVNKYAAEYDEQIRALLANDPDADPQTLMASIMEKPTYNSQNRGPTVSTEEVMEEIRKCLKENEEKRQTGRGKQMMRKTDIHGYLKKKGYDISYSTVKRICQKLDETEGHHAEAFIRQEYDPGEICEFDWGAVLACFSGLGNIRSSSCISVMSSGSGQLSPSSAARFLAFTTVLDDVPLARTISSVFRLSEQSRSISR